MKKDILFWNIRREMIMKSMKDLVLKEIMEQQCFLFLSPEYKNLLNTATFAKNYI